MTDKGLIVFCSICSVEFKRYFFQGIHNNRSIHEALKLYGLFYNLEAPEEKWSECHMFKCYCPRCFQWARCHHAVLATMVCDPNVCAQ